MIFKVLVLCLKALKVEKLPLSKLETLSLKLSFAIYKVNAEIQERRKEK